MSVTVRLAFPAVVLVWCQASIAQNLQPLPQAVAKMQGETLLRARAAEVRDMKPDNPATKTAVAALLEHLVKDPRVMETVVYPCPTPPGPAPARNASMLAIAKPSAWESRMPMHVQQAEVAIKSNSKLSAEALAELSGFVAPTFRAPGRPDKFETVVSPGCPTPGPSPARTNDKKGEERP